MPEECQADPLLGIWVRYQRQKFKNNALCPDRKDRLDAIGFQADPLAHQWNKKYSKLEEYHAEHGHCNVPRGYQADPALGRWVDRQRQKLKKKALSPEQKARLDAIGFQLDLLPDQWNENLKKKALRLKRKVRQTWPLQCAAGIPGDLPLGRWVDKQRQKLKDDALYPEQKAHLDAIGFKIMPTMQRKGQGGKAKNELTTRGTEKAASAVATNPVRKHASSMGLVYKRVRLSICDYVLFVATANGLPVTDRYGAIVLWSAIADTSTGANLHKDQDKFITKGRETNSTVQRDHSLYAAGGPNLFTVADNSKRAAGAQNTMPRSSGYPPYRTFHNRFISKQRAVEQTAGHSTGGAGVGTAPGHDENGVFPANSRFMARNEDFLPVPVDGLRIPTDRGIVRVSGPPPCKKACTALNNGRVTTDTWHNPSCVANLTRRKGEYIDV